MKKPILLVVDDDPAVLSALETELTRAFGQILRVEAFEDPREVFSTLPRWNRDHRPIALAVVDQKMPGLTGVELLKALRSSVTKDAPARTSAEPNAMSAAVSFHAARHMRAVLLTGYAGLDSALAARNEAGVDRYIEKPWQPAILFTLLRKLLTQHLTNSYTGRYLEFREVTAAEEIRRFLGLRYEMYAASPSLHYLLPPYSKKRLDVDAYDTQSRFYALFSVGLDGAEQIGGMRLIGTSNPAAARAIVLIVQEDDSLREPASRATPYPVEIPEKWPDRKVAEALLDRIRARGEGVVEASRMVVVPSHRGRSQGFGHVALAMYEGAVAHILEVLGYENTLQCCSSRFQPAAARVGFRAAEDTAPTWSRRLKDTVVLLHGRAEHMPEPVRERVRSVGMGVSRRGAACRCATFPECVGRPYETSEFSATDLFCPRLAQTLVARPVDSQGLAAAEGTHS